jgi:hypothetical protein
MIMLTHGCHIDTLSETSVFVRDLADLHLLAKCVECQYDINKGEQHEQQASKMEMPELR